MLTPQQLDSGAAAARPVVDVGSPAIAISPTAIALVAIGLMLVLFGGWLVWWLRDQAAEFHQLRTGDFAGTLRPSQNPPDNLSAFARLTRWAIELSIPTRLVSGLVSLLTGYQCIAWGTPDGWLRSFVAPDRWWLVVVIAGIIIALSRAADYQDSRREQRPDTPGDGSR